MKLKIKETHKTTIVGFNNSGFPLGSRNDLLELAIIARNSNDEHLLNLFETPLPALDELLAEKAKAILPVIIEK